MPAVLACDLMKKPVLYLMRVAGLHRLGPSCPAVGEIFRVNEHRPVLVDSRSMRISGELEPKAVAIIDHAVGAGGPDDLWHRVGQLAKSLFAGAEIGLGLASRRDVNKGSNRAGGLAVVIVEGCRVAVKIRRSSVVEHHLSLVAHDLDAPRRPTAQEAPREESPPRRAGSGNGQAARRQPP